MRESSRKSVHKIGWIATVLVIIGALNWLMVGLFGIDIVATLFRPMSWLTRLVYVLVGLGGIYEIYFARELAREGTPGATPPRPV